MARIGLYPAVIIVAFRAVVPFFIFKFGRLIGLAPLLVLAFSIGVGYGAVKAEYSWSEGSLGNAMFMGASALALVGYVALSYAAVRFISGTASSLRRE